MPCVANEEHEVQCKITFKADGAVEGCLSCKTDGDFQIKGAYNFSTGIVAWGQFPINPRPNAKATEFYGDIYNLSSGPSRIAGTFLTSNGQYCVLNLVNPLASEVKATLPTLLKGSMTPARDGAVSPATKQGESSEDSLPTLLRGSIQPVYGGKVIYYKGKKFVSNGGILVN